MAAVTKLHAARQPPIHLKPVTEYHHYPTTRVLTTQFDVPNPNNTTTRTVTRKQDLPFAPDASSTLNASSVLSTTSKKHRRLTHFL